MRWHSIWPVWALAIAGAVAVAVFVPDDRIVWLPIVLGTCTVVAFAAQLSLPTERGLVDRLFVAVGGTIVILAAATVVYKLLALAV